MNSKLRVLSEIRLPDPKSNQISTPKLFVIGPITRRHAVQCEPSRCNKRSRLNHFKQGGAINVPSPPLLVRHIHADFLQPASRRDVLRLANAVSAQDEA